jgi:hypothetical protein
VLRLTPVGLAPNQGRPGSGRDSLRWRSWTLSVLPTCTPRAGLCARSVPSWAFIGAQSANGSRVPASPCVPGGPPAHHASTREMLELRDQGLTWTEVATQVDMTVSGVGRRCRRARPPKPQRVGDGSRCSPTPSIKTLRLAYEQRLLIVLVEPHAAELTAARRAAHRLAALGRACVLHVPGADGTATQTTATVRC